MVTCYVFDQMGSCMTALKTLKTLFWCTDCVLGQSFTVWGTSSLTTSENDWSDWFTKLYLAVFTCNWLRRDGQLMQGVNEGECARLGHSLCPQAAVVVHSWCLVCSAVYRKVFDSVSTTSLSKHVYKNKHSNLHCLFTERHSSFTISSEYISNISK